MKEGDRMEIKKDYDLYDLEDELWSGAEETVRKIIDADKEDEFEQLWYETWEDVPDLVEVNDWLRFEDEDILKALGIGNVGGEYLVYNIDYCVEEDDCGLDENDYDCEQAYENACEEKIEEIKNDLPVELHIDIDDDTDDDMLEDELCELITEETGWLVNSFDYMKIEN